MDVPSLRFPDTSGQEKEESTFILLYHQMHVTLVCQPLLHSPFLFKELGTHVSLPFHLSIHADVPRPPRLSISTPTTSIFPKPRPHVGIITMDLTITHKGLFELCDSDILLLDHKLLSFHFSLYFILLKSILHPRHDLKLLLVFLVIHNFSSFTFLPL